MHAEPYTRHAVNCSHTDRWRCHSTLTGVLTQTELTRPRNDCQADCLCFALLSPFQSAKLAYSQRHACYVTGWSHAHSASDQWGAYNNLNDLGYVTRLWTIPDTMWTPWPKYMLTIFKPVGRHVKSPLRDSSASQGSCCCPAWMSTCGI